MLYFNMRSLYILTLIFNVLASPVIPAIKSKIVIIADLHADINRFKDVLKDAKILDYNENWIAPPNTTVIQLGDQIDPKQNDKNDIDDSHHFKMIYYTNQLQKYALENDSKFISLIGNHELMNIEKIKRKPNLRDIIAHRPVLLFFQNYAFCHGGFKKRHYYLLNIYNKNVSDINQIWYKYVYDIPVTLTEELLLKNLILDQYDSILYTRIPDSKNDIYNLFNMLNIDYMFVGHSETDFVYLKYKIWCLDLQLKSAFDSMVYNYIIIENDNIIIKSLESYPTFFDLVGYN